MAKEAEIIEQPLLREITRLREALRRIAELPNHTFEAYTAANIAIEIARETLKQ